MGTPPHSYTVIWMLQSRIKVARYLRPIWFLAHSVSCNQPTVTPHTRTPLFLRHMLLADNVTSTTTQHWNSSLQGASEFPTNSSGPSSLEAESLQLSQGFVVDDATGS